MEDMIGASAVVEELSQRIEIYHDSDAPLIAQTLYLPWRNELAKILRWTTGGKNIIAAGLEGDIDFAVRTNSISVVGRAEGMPPVIRALPAKMTKNKLQKKSAGSGPVGGGNRC